MFRYKHLHPALLSVLLLSFILNFSPAKTGSTAEAAFRSATVLGLYSQNAQEIISEPEMTATPSPTPSRETAEVQAQSQVQSSRPAQAAPTPTDTFAIQPLPVNTPGICPESTMACVPCNAGEPACRHLDGAPSGYKGWSCQNNNPGNIRYSQSRIALITQFGGPAPCGSMGPNPSSQYMVFTDYLSGRSALKSYITAIGSGAHSGYLPECALGACSLRYFFSKYAPAADQNDPNSYSNYVANYIEVDVDLTPLSWIIANKLDQMADAIQIHEGWFVL